MKQEYAILAALAVFVMGYTSARADITIDLAAVGNAGNVNDSTGYGSVAYNYQIATKEVSLFSYTSFLNAVGATDTYGLYNTNMGTDLNIAGISRSGSSGSYTYSVIGSGNHPVTYVSWFDAARFSNWMANGQPTGSQVGTTTENGAYTLSGQNSGVGFTKNGINPNTSAAPTFWVPSEDEWYKAAYYDPTKGGSNYWLYPTQSDSLAGNTIGVADSANYYYGNYAKDQNGLLSYLSVGGAYGSNSASFYGTFDQGGNVLEWNDAVIAGSYRGLRGGAWYGVDANLQSSGRYNDDPANETALVGFRVASVPEPSTIGLLALVGAGFLVWRCRKVTPLLNQ